MATLMEKWAPVLDLEGAPKIEDAHKRFVTAQLLENQMQSMAEEAKNNGGHYLTMLNEDVVLNHGGDGIAMGNRGTNPAMAGYDTVLINLVRRAMPQLIAFDVCGVQPMTTPAGMIFAMRAKYGNGTFASAEDQSEQYRGHKRQVPEGADFSEDSHVMEEEGGYVDAASHYHDRHLQPATEALYREAWDAYSGDGFGAAQEKSNWAEVFEEKGEEGFADEFKVGHGMSTLQAEALGENGKNPWAEMGFSIEKSTVTARTRALKAEYTLELAQDLKTVHGLDAETELSNILATEILSEMNREIIRSMYLTAKVGCAVGTARKGVFDLDIDADGRWSSEKYKGLMMRIEREANAIAQDTRRGRGNFIICSSDVASALNMAGMLDYAPALQNNLAVNEAQSTFAGVLNGKYKVFIDPYQSNQSASQYCVVGYKGATAYDAGMFYCPYVPLQLLRATDPQTFQPKIGFKTRYGLTVNPFILKREQFGGDVDIRACANRNYYFRKFVVRNL